MGQNLDMFAPAPLGGGIAILLNLRSRFASQFRDGSDAHLFGKTHASLFGGFEVFSGHESAALHDGATKVALGQRRGAKVEHRGCSRGLSEDGDVLRIPAKTLYIRLHPLQRFQLVEHAVVAGGMKRILRGELRMSEIAEDPKTVVYGHQHNALDGQALTVERRERARALDKASPVKPNHHRTLLRSRGCRGPDVQVEAVLAHGLRTLIELHLIEGPGLECVLHADISERIRAANARP